ncbi:MAG: asparaginase [Acidobacteria bacterium]|nr:asparaginase [Acidobacteriota bacterium]
MTLLRSRLVVVCLGLLIVGTTAAAAAELPRVKMVATGGTISNRMGGRLTANELVAMIPDVQRFARPEFEQFSNVASSEITLDQWLALSRRLNDLFATQPDLAGLVVTSGTDTLEELAYFLHLTVRDERPVVVVGSMRNPSTVGYEGAANLLEAFRVAASPDARGKGVLVVLNDEINSAREVTKTDALRLQTFQSRTVGVLGVVDADRVVFYRGTVKRHTSRSEFDVSTITALPRVDVVMVYQDAPGDLIKAAVDFGAKGIVIAAAGAGATSGTQSDALSYAADKGAVVVTTTRAGSGRISGGRSMGAPPAAVIGATPAAPATVRASGSATGAGSQATGPAQAPRRRRAFVGGEDLQPIKARILLMLALTKTSDPAEIQRMFLEY